MYIVHYFDQARYELVMSLHSTRAAAEIAAGEMLRRFEVNQRSGPDFRGEAVSLSRYRLKRAVERAFRRLRRGRASLPHRA